jgi:hypothetical protein
MWDEELKLARWHARWLRHQLALTTDPKLRMELLSEQQDVYRTIDSILTRRMLSGRGCK